MPKKRKPRAPLRRRERMLQVLRGPKAKKYPLLRVSKEGDVGFNLVCVETTTIPPGLDRPPTELPVDLRVKLPKGTWASIDYRGGTHNKYPTLRLCSAPIDNGYVGPIDPRLKNIGQEPVVVEAGVSICQLVLRVAVVPDVIEVDDLPRTERGESRYGSTGK